MQRASAMRSCQTVWRAIALPNATRVEALAHQLERALGAADRAHAVMDAARAEAALGDLEAAAFAQQDVRDRHPHVLEHHFHVAVRRIVVAEHRERAHDRDARRVGRHQRSSTAASARPASGSVLPMTM